MRQRDQVRGHWHTISQTPIPTDHGQDQHEDKQAPGTSRGSTLTTQKDHARAALLTEVPLGRTDRRHGCV